METVLLSLLQELPNNQTNKEAKGFRWIPETSPKGDSWSQQLRYLAPIKLMLCLAKVTERARKRLSPAFPDVSVLG